jgi:hypothetical protein
MKRGAVLKEKIKIVLRYLVAISFGFAVGYFVKSELRVPATDTDNEWQSQFNEEKNHGRILKFQKTMEELQANGAKNPDDLTEQLDAQLRIEDFVIKSREAEYAKWLPFTPLFAGVLGAVLGLLTGLLGRKPSGSWAPDSGGALGWQGKIGHQPDGSEPD